VSSTGGSHLKLFQIFTKVRFFEVPYPRTNPYPTQPDPNVLKGKKKGYLTKV